MRTTAISLSLPLILVISISASLSYIYLAVALLCSPLFSFQLTVVGTPKCSSCMVMIRYRLTHAQAPPSLSLSLSPSLRFSGLLHVSVSDALSYGRPRFDWYPSSRNRTWYALWLPLSVLSPGVICHPPSISVGLSFSVPLIFATLLIQARYSLFSVCLSSRLL